MALPSRLTAASCALLLASALASCSANRSGGKASTAAGSGPTQAGAGSSPTAQEATSGSAGTSEEDAGSAALFGGSASVNGGASASGATNANGGAAGTPPVAQGCGTADATCGGDPAGTWQSTAYCVSVPTSTLTEDTTSIVYHCEGLTIDTSGTTALVSYQVAHDGSYTVTGGATSVIVVTVPKTCIVDQPCTVLTDSASAVVSDLGTSCKLSQTSTSDVQGSGTLRNYQQNSHTTSYHYCVDGDQLLQQTIEPSGRKTRILAKRTQ